MEIKIVKRPLQDAYTKPEELQYSSDERWCVKQYMYREGDGGMNLWFKELERVRPDVIYLYEIKSWKDKLVVGSNKDEWVEDIFYSVRCDLRKF